MAGNNALQILRGHTATLSQSNEVLLAGQPLYDLDTHKLYIGDGGGGTIKSLLQNNATIDVGVTGVKGNSESSYRTGNVNLTPANIGAVSLTGNETISGAKTFSSAATFTSTANQMYGLRLKNTGSDGCKLNFGDGDYVYFHEDTDDHLKLYSKKGLSISTDSTFTQDALNVSGRVTGTLIYEGSSRVYSPSNKPPRQIVNQQSVVVSGNHMINSGSNCNIDIKSRTPQFLGELVLLNSGANFNVVIGIIGSTHTGSTLNFFSFVNYYLNDEEELYLCSITN